MLTCQMIINGHQRPSRASPPAIVWSAKQRNSGCTFDLQSKLQGLHESLPDFRELMCKECGYYQQQALIHAPWQVQPIVHNYPRWHRKVEHFTIVLIVEGEMVC